MVHRLARGVISQLLSSEKQHSLPPAASAMHSTITEAIKQRRVLTVFYDGDRRTVEPHTYGINSAGNEALSCYQIAGTSSSGKPEGWKMLLLSKLGTVTMTEQKFTPRTSRSPWADNPMKQVFAQV